MTFDEIYDYYKNLDPLKRDAYLKEVAKETGALVSTLRKEIEKRETPKRKKEDPDLDLHEFRSQLVGEARKGIVSGIPIFFDIAAGKYLFQRIEDREDEHGNRVSIKMVDFLDTTSVRKLIQESAKRRAGALLDSKDVSETVEWIPAYLKGYDPHKPPLYKSTESSTVLTKNMCEIPSHLKEAREEAAKKEKLKSYKDAVIRIKEDLPYTYQLLSNLFVEREHLEYFVNWLAYIVQTMRKTRNAVVLLGDQGTGKGVMWENIISWIFGKDNCVVASNSDIASQFNVIFDNRLFVCFNEIKGDFRQGNTLYETLKAYITDPEFMVNVKNVSQYRVQNHFNCIFFSNHEVPLQIESGDRRYSVFKAGKKLVRIVENGDTDLFVKRIKEERGKFLQMLFSFAADADYATKLIETDQKRKIKRLSNTKQDIFKAVVSEKDQEYFREALGDIIDGKEDEKAIREWVADADGRRVPEYFPETNRVMFDEFLVNVNYGVFSNKVLEWAYRMLVSADDSKQKISKFWTYVFDENIRLGANRIRCKAIKGAHQAIVWGKVYVLAEGKWTLAGDAAEVIVEYPDGSAEKAGYVSPTETDGEEEVPF